VTAPFVEASYYSIELGRGSYPTDADSIGLPIAQFTIGLLVVSPMFLALCWLCLRRYPGSVRLWAWNRRRRWWSFVWTVLFAGAILVSTVGLFRVDVITHPLDAIQTTALVYLLLALRASVVSQLFPERA
jgi:hypothetical protein